MPNAYFLYFCNDLPQRAIFILKRRPLKKVYSIIALGLIACTIGTISCKNSGTEKTGTATETANTTTTPPSNEPPGAALISKSDCGTCHTADTKIVGPAYKEIAAKYPNTPENVSMLVNKVMGGGSGVWGTTPMAAHPALSKADAEVMVSYILSMK